VAADKVAILGQGYVGLPLALRAVEVGFDVVAFDVDEERVGQLLDASSFIDDVSDGELASALASGHYHPTTDPASLTGFRVAVICVPTPLRDGAPDVRYIEAAADLLAPRVLHGCCVVLESTTYPGTTEEVLVPRIESRSGLRAGLDFYVGYSPERIDPSNPIWNVENTPKIVAGIDEASLKVVDEFYSTLVERTVAVASLKEAELAKLLENTFRHVNIALVNELAIYANDLGIDVWSVIAAASTKPFGFMTFTPGPGVGGHCLPIDPSYLSWRVRRSLRRAFRFVELANDINEHMPDYVVDRVVAKLNRSRQSANGAQIFVLGLAYKRNTGDARESPALLVIDRLVDLGAAVRVCDPLVHRLDVPAAFEFVSFNESELAAASLVLVLTDHDVFDWKAVERVAHKVLDTRNRLSGTRAEIL
jgi:UDP-N-acetyl-D-glucosamine dehydrogenase